MPPKAKKKTPAIKWRNSLAKKLLRQDILDGIVSPTMAPDIVFDMRKEYNDYNFHNFKTNLKNLFGSIEREAAKKPKDPKWRKSKAKEMLYQDICDGTVTDDMDGATVFMMRPEFQLYKENNFKTNLKNLREAIKKDYKRMQGDLEDFTKDLQQLAIIRANDTSIDYEGMWHRSPPAQPQLEQDVKDGLHTRMKPSVLYRRGDRAVYRDFAPDLFRNHLHQEVTKQRRFND